MGLRRRCNLHTSRARRGARSKKLLIDTEHGVVWLSRISETQQTVDRSATGWLVSERIGTALRDQWLAL